MATAKELMNETSVDNEVPVCSSCKRPLDNFPLTMRNTRVEMRCKQCVQTRNPEAYNRNSAWADRQENRLTAERMA